jgi:hypothetical protein
VQTLGNCRLIENQSNEGDSTGCAVMGEETAEVKDGLPFVGVGDLRRGPARPAP